MKKRLKGSAAALLAAAILTGSLVGCAPSASTSDGGDTSGASGAGPAKDVSLSIMIGYDAASVGQHYIDQWQTIADKLGYKISLDAPGANPYKTKIQVALAGGELPDIFSVAGGTGEDPYIDAGVVLPVQNYIDSSGINFKPMYKSKYKDGNSYIIPAREDSFALTFANTDLLSKIGVSVPKTWDDLLNVVKATNSYNKAHGTKLAAIGLGASDRWVAELLYTMVVNRENPNAFDDLMSGKATMESNPVFIDAARKIQQLSSMGAFPSGYMQTASADASTIFEAGQYVLYPHQSSMINIFENKMPDKFEVFQFPDCATPADPNYAQNLMNGNGTVEQGLMISKKSKNPDEAAKLALEFAKEVNQINVTKYGYPGIISDDSIQMPSDIAKPSVDFAAMAKNETHLTSYWYAAVPSNTGEQWRDLVAKLFGNAVTPEDFVAQGQKILGQAVTKK